MGRRYAGEGKERSRRNGQATKDALTLSRHDRFTLLLHIFDERWGVESRYPVQVMDPRRALTEGPLPRGAITGGSDSWSL